MIEGQGFFGVLDLSSREVTLTRNGAFYPAMVGASIDMVDQFGNEVNEEGLYLSDGHGNFIIDQNGNMISIQNDQDALPVGIFDFANRTGLIHEPGTQFKMSLEDVKNEMGTGELKRGMLELSNVDLAEEITKVIESQRAYSMALKLVQTTDEIETTINGLRG